jgi:Chlorophyll A-B binding protein
MKISAALVVFTSLFASASAFVPSSSKSTTYVMTTSQLAMSSTSPDSKEYTAMDWKGYYTGLGKERDADMMTKIPKDFGFDPLGLGELGRAGMFFQREAEIKHCRLAMLAAAGW